jgi:hypothetical protein
LISNTVMKFKIPVRGEIAPLKLRFDYIDLDLNQLISKSQIIEMKNSFEVFLSKSTDDPNLVKDEL